MKRTRKSSTIILLFCAILSGIVGYKYAIQIREDSYAKTAHPYTGTESNVAESALRIRRMSRSPHDGRDEPVPGRIEMQRAIDLETSLAEALDAPGGFTPEWLPVLHQIQRSFADGNEEAAQYLNLMSDPSRAPRLRCILAICASGSYDPVVRNTLRRLLLEGHPLVGAGAAIALSIDHRFLKDLDQRFVPSINLMRSTPDQQDEIWFVFWKDVMLTTTPGRLFLSPDISYEYWWIGNDAGAGFHEGVIGQYSRPILDRLDREAIATYLRNASDYIAREIPEEPGSRIALLQEAFSRLTRDPTDYFPRGPFPEDAVEVLIDLAGKEDLGPVRHWAIDRLGADAGDVSADFLFDRWVRNPEEHGDGSESGGAHTRVLGAYITNRYRHDPEYLKETLVANWRRAGCGAGHVRTILDHRLAATDWKVDLLDSVWGAVDEASRIRIAEAMHTGTFRQVDGVGYITERIRTDPSPRVRAWGEVSPSD